jgi:hypothetical protein
MGGDEIWYIDPATGINPRLWYIARGAQNTTLPLANYWASRQNSYSLEGGKALFTALSDCNIFLENIHKPFDLQDDERKKWIAEVKFLKAYFHFWLFRMYGPIPLIKENLLISASHEDAERYREPVDDVVDYIASLLDEAAAGLEPVILDPMSDMGRPTRVIALAVKAQLLTLAASPLYNGEEDKVPEFSMIDKRNIDLFPQTYRVEKWQKAAQALRVAIDEAHAAGHHLYDFHATTIPGIIVSNLSEQTVLSMQTRCAAVEKWNPEIIWGDVNTNPAALQQACLPAFTTAHNAGAVRKNYAPTMHVVEQFYTKNGLPITEDKEWEGINPMMLRTAEYVDRYYIREGFTTIQLHFDREPRFYGAIAFDGGTFYGNGYLSSDNSLPITEFKFNTGANLMFTERYSSTGYLCKKLINPATTITSGMAVSTSRYAFPIIRLADLYLMYAEALNEAGSETPDPDVYFYINEVRKRTGLNGVVETWHDFAVDSQKDKPLSKRGMREIIRRERLNELAFEGARFWDLRRWNLAEEYMNRGIYGLNIRSETLTFYRRMLLFQPKFEKKDYFWPIKQSVLLNNQHLIQNKGW